MLEGENHLLHCLFYSFAIIKSLVQISKKSNKEVKKMYVSHVTESIKLTKIMLFLCFNEAVHSKLFKTALGLTTVGFRIS